MKILLTGASGLIGMAFTKAASAAGHSITPVSRRKTSGAIQWDPSVGNLDPAAIERFDAIVHLAGESIAARRWSPAQKKRIRESRVRGTQLLAETVAQLKRRPALFVSASAIGYYGDCADRVLTEQSPAGTDFLAGVCRDWERATEPAARTGIRVVHIRTGIVLARDGGALPKMVLPFKFGAGGKIGSGGQYMSWIDLEDEVNAILFCIARGSIRGPVNCAGPAPVTNAEFTQALGRVLNRPTFLPLPAFAARLMLGEMADALLLSSQRVVPQKLVEEGFEFRHTNLEETLRRILK